MVSEKIQEISFSIISNVGEGKSLAIDAIKWAKKGEEQKAKEALKNAEEMVMIAERAHFELISQEARGIDLQFSMLLTHAEDQMLSTQTVILLARELTEIWKTLHQKNSKNKNQKENY